MAKNKAAKITSLGSYVYKNSRYKELNGDTLPTRDNIEQYIYIPCISNLGDLLSEMSVGEINGKKCYKIIENINEASRLNFGDNNITFMTCSRNQGDKNLGILKTDLDKLINISEFYKKDTSYYNKEGYSLAFPLKNFTTFGYAYKVFSSSIPQWVLVSNNKSSLNNNMSSSYEYLVNRYSGVNKKFLSAKYFEDIDSFLIPCSCNGRIYVSDNENINPNKFNCFGYNIHNDNIGSFGISTPSGDLSGGNQDDFLELNLTDTSSYEDTGIISIKTSYRRWYYGNYYSIGGFIFNDYNYLLYLNSYFFSGEAPGVYSFIYDDINNDICIFASYLTTNSNVESYIIPFSAMSIAPMFGAPSLPSSFNINDFISSLLGNIIDEDKVPKPDDELFNDGGPDIDGAGDPYNTDEFNNIGSSVGGDADPGKDLNSVDATPNTSFNNFMQATGFFGSYVVSNADLVEYTDTLKMLYSHADDVFFGEAAGLQADRITKNTIGLHMLPLTIPSSDYADTIFSMGNVGIAATDNYASYVAGNNYAHANYLTKLTRTFNVPLGTIKHNYDNFLDFAPYSSASLYIPYIGKVQLPINLVQSTSSDSRPMRLEFRVDYTSGDFMAILFCNIKGVDIALSHWNGNCARPVKVSVDDDSSAIIAGANRLASMFSFGASGSIGAQTSRGAGDFSSSSDPVSHNSMDFKNHTEGINSSYHEGHSAGKSASASFRMPSMPSSVTTNQHMIGNGTATGELGYLGIQDIVLTVERPIWWKPYDYGNLVGYPTKKVAKLASVKGFARVSDAHIRCKATATEKNEIATLLSEGVIF